MSKYSSFAVVGAGFVGLPITKALTRKNASVVVLTRSSSKTDLGDGVKVAPINYTDIAAIIRVLKENRVEVVISTLGSEGLASQNTIAEAAKAAGVKLFVPSEFGVPTEGSTEGIFAVKDKSAKYIQSLGVPTARFYIGFFTQTVPDVFGYKVNKKINILENLKGDKPASFTAIEDVAGFVAHVLTTLHPAQLDYSVFRIQGQAASLIELAPILDTTVERVKEVPGPNSSLSAFFQTHIETGGGSTGWDAATGSESKDKAGSSNYLWEGHHWKSIRDVIFPK
ncbi:hypothetical protein D9615_000160 [Tricholomella constricta]|uniref:NmrA-like domain-containing protein n=1 Tax=Tricholomella constricta TaxID=117010 RepID=A0A8H5MBS7_9AGAR|nr:hypothetical protein D9615_000160 [Tricholomella constricta]